MASIPVLKKAFCCLELATGASIIGWLSAIGNLLMIIWFIYSNVTAKDLPSENLFFIYLCFAILLIRGVMTSDRRLIVPYLVATIIFLINLIYLAYLFKNDTATVTIIIIELIGGYFWACIYSYYHDLKFNSVDIGTPLLKKAFWCLELETGATIIGWLSAIANLLVVIWATVQLIHSDIMLNYLPLIIFFIINLYFAIVLIRGVMARNRHLIALFLVATIYFLIILIYKAALIGEATMTKTIIVIEIIAGYFWACVYSFYHELKVNFDGIDTPLIKKSFCCLKLATGAVIIGWLGAIGNLVVGGTLFFISSKITTNDLPAIIFFIINISVSIILIRGAMMWSRRLIVAYLVGTFAFIITLMFEAFTIKDAATNIIIIFIEIIAGYFYACVYSFYQELQINLGDIVRGSLI